MFEAKRNMKRKRLVKNFSQLEDLNEHGRNVVVIKETERILLEVRKRTFSHLVHPFGE